MSLFSDGYPVTPSYKVHSTIGQVVRFSSWKGEFDSLMDYKRSCDRRVNVQFKQIAICLNDESGSSPALTTIKIPVGDLIILLIAMCSYYGIICCVGSTETQVRVLYIPSINSIKIRNLFKIVRNRLFKSSLTLICESGVNGQHV